MTEVAVTPMEPGRFGVQVSDGPTTTSHVVRADEASLERLGLAGSDPELVVRESVLFLLEREPPTSILSDFSLDDIARYFPEYADEIGARLT